MRQHHEPLTRGSGMTFGQMLERIRYDGAYPTRERAERSTRPVLAALGQQLTGDERTDLAACLPDEAATLLSTQPSPTTPLTGREFVRDLATRTGGTPATASWDTCAVLTTVATIAGPDLMDRVLAQLPPGYGALFGRRELSGVG
ncbi:DUF2267 domain-containing protein [Streptomyces sp. NPDC057638]|uniref:DUF2267 domain-containing protein n=1 Tax=Streptomyces sp. NPDC057638 TaxID=3346190 RepID=UPI0036963A67